tara:strand:+ start:57 stop:494 length:438 start_codon:yes stop_codon:yes gene_type:complete
MTSVLNVDTIAAKNGTSPVALTKQEAVKFWSAYDAQTQTTDGSLNQSSLTDQQTGIFYSSFTSSFASATDKCSVGNALNTTDGTSRVANKFRSGLHVSTGAADGTYRAISSSEVQYSCCEGAAATTNGDVVDAKGIYMTVTGDLA